MNEDIDIREVAEQLEKTELRIVACRSFDELRGALAKEVNHLINHDFSLLISILYRLDVSEHKVREALANVSGVAGGEIIADFIIQRQIEKIERRKSFGQSKDDIPEDERW